ncbi:MAG TPA: hypothetical protein VK726_06935 [Acetobacteraceae bacterium]|nr:hypothetical protein [Acetobacteraceae bacterium]
MENDASDLPTSMNRLTFWVAEIKAICNATLPHRATKAAFAGLRADLADRPSKINMSGVPAMLITAYAGGLAALAVLQ